MHPIFACTCLSEQRPYRGVGFQAISPVIASHMYVGEAKPSLGEKVLS